MEQERTLTRGSDSKGARAHAKGRLSVFLASLDPSVPIMVRHFFPAKLE